MPYKTSSLRITSNRCQSLGIYSITCRAEGLFYGCRRRQRNYKPDSNGRVHLLSANGDGLSEEKEFSLTNGNIDKKSYISEVTTYNLAGARTADVVSSDDNINPKNEGISFHFDPNFVAVTGETGSGKSLLLRTAANLVLGGKASPSLIPRNGNSARVELGEYK